MKFILKIDCEGRTIFGETVLMKAGEELEYCGMTRPGDVCVLRDGKPIYLTAESIDAAPNTE